MILAIEIDNSRINIGAFDAEQLRESFCVATDLNKTSDEYAVTLGGIFEYYKIDRATVDGAVLSSVVPQLTDTVTDAVRKLSNDVCILTVGKGIKTGFPIKIDNPAEMGTDLVANAAAVLSILKRENKQKTPCVIIDMGTATTVFAINSNSEYIGGCIMPGVGMSFDVLHGKTALLPNVTPSAPTRAIGKNSQEALRSGIILGHAAMLDGFIDRFSEEMNSIGKTEIFITGEYAETVINSCKHVMSYEPKLTLLGLHCIYKNNI